MDKRQKRILIEFFAVIMLTGVAVIAMINFRDWVNRSPFSTSTQGLIETFLTFGIFLTMSILSSSGSQQP